MTDTIGTSPLVLVVDDDPGARMLASASLKKAGYSTVEVADGEAGVAAWDRFRPDLILMDAVMPGMDGFSAIREIRNRLGGDRVPILMMTGLDDLASIHRAYEAGATSFAIKPVNWVILGYRVGYLLRSSRAFLDLASSEEKTRALLRAIPDLIFRIGADGTVLDLVAGKEPGGIPSGRDWTGRKLPEVMPFGVAEQVMLHAEQARKTGGIQLFEYVLESGGEPRSFEARVVSIPDGESLFIARDMSDRKKAEERLAYMAYHDTLTGLPNRVTLTERLARDLSAAKRRKEVVGIVLSTWTGSRRSTTPSATRPATGFSWRWRGDSRVSHGKRTPWPEWRGTNSASSCRTSGTCNPSCRRYTGSNPLSRILLNLTGRRPM